MFAFEQLKYTVLKTPGLIKQLDWLYGTRTAREG